MKNKKSYS